MKDRKRMGKMKGWIIYVGVLIAMFAACNHFLIISEVPTESMAGTIAPGDNLVCTRFGIGEEEIGRYDILIFTPPDEPGISYVKRLIGLPGETIEVKDGKVYADGVELEDSFTNGPQNRKGDGVYRVPEGCYFFMGDNRNNSNDSRFWENKFVPVANIKAKARLICFPFTRIGWL